MYNFVTKIIYLMDDYIVEQWESMNHKYLYNVPIYPNLMFYKIFNSQYKYIKNQMSIENINVELGSYFEREKRNPTHKPMPIIQKIFNDDFKILTKKLEKDDFFENYYLLRTKKPILLEYFVVNSYIGQYKNFSISLHTFLNKENKESKNICFAMQEGYQEIGNKRTIILGSLNIKRLEMIKNQLKNFIN